MNSGDDLIRRGLKHDTEMLDIDDEYINGKAECEGQDKGLTAVERYKNEEVGPDDLDGQGLNDIMELVPSSNTQKPDVFRFLNLPREIRDNVCTLNGCNFTQR